MLVELATDGRLVYANRSVQTLIGRSPESVIGSSFLEFVVPDDRERMLSTFQKIVETGDEPTSHFGVLHQDGSTTFVAGRARVHTEPGERPRVFVSLRDITEESFARARDQSRFEHFRALVESDRPSALFNAAGENLFANRKFQSVLGRIRHLGEVRERVGREGQHLIDANWKRAQNGASGGRLEFEFIRESGDAVWLSAAWSAHRSEGGERLFSVHYADITHRKRVEKALRATAELHVGADGHRLQRAIEAIGAALRFDRLVFAKLLAGEEGKARIIHGFDHSLPQSESPCEEIQLEGLPDLVPSRGDTCIHPMGLQRILPSVSDRLGVAYESYAGVPIILENDTQFGFIAGYGKTAIEDLELTRTLLTVFAKRVAFTESYRLNERALEESRARFEVITDHSPDLLVEVDDGFEILFISEACQSILGKSADAFVGKSLLDLIHPDDLPEVRKGAIAFEKGRSDALYVSKSQHADGSWRTLEWRSVPLSASDGSRRALILARDITDRLQTEAALRESEIRLDDASRMEAVGRFAGGIAHDFNNLLTAIIGYSDLVLDQVGPGSVAYGDAEEVLRAADRAGALTRQLLTFSRRQSKPTTTVDLNAVLAEIDRMLRRLIPENIEIVTLQSGELFPVLADRGQLEQVLMNLVINACDAMPLGGHLTIETRPFETHAPYSTRSGRLKPGAYTVLSIRDTGTGMDEPTLAQIFEPFFTTKGVDAGTGLGLATVYEIVQQNRGQIDVESIPGTGTTFFVYFPAALASISAAEDDAGDAKTVRGGIETILVVEDAENVRTLLTRTLSRRGYTVLAAESATAALRHCARHEGRIDLLLTDVVLPKASGVEIARRAVALHPNIRVHFMSGFPDETLEQHGISRASVPVLNKPFSPSAALRAVRECLDGNAEGLPKGLMETPGRGREPTTVLGLPPTR